MLSVSDKEVKDIFLLCDMTQSLTDIHTKSTKIYLYFVNQIKLIQSLNSEALFASEGFIVNLCDPQLSLEPQTRPGKIKNTLFGEKKTT